MGVQPRLEVTYNFGDFIRAFGQGGVQHPIEFFNHVHTQDGDRTAAGFFEQHRFFEGLFIPLVKDKIHRVEVQIGALIIQFKFV